MRPDSTESTRQSRPMCDRFLPKKTGQQTIL
jgi:hypothetical protein